MNYALRADRHSLPFGEARKAPEGRPKGALKAARRARAAKQMLGIEKLVRNKSDSVPGPSGQSPFRTLVSVPGDITTGSNSRDS